ncbi:thiosulfate reductase cytochrome b subunit [Rhodoblastus acidophilus]|uniref:cytochrome b/b6 domain-containing protein n=1 Tax=Rhodoblastus acidophilus TaxID=1074 RepID=UPI002225748B|nr:cytochrome b/b6 domain-containing protein [Rhodoblastus acidophilus]MCW2286508.1 thiosulfate reductase cytochrome b subunit [Rhodoblastus acidophilus]MCW2335357.1 thiosulfate reductase cytochrome b subunit [Rhodoblastus acidophilus]
MTQSQPLTKAHAKIFVHRHALVTRITHWINVLCILILLPSGLQILMAHPAFYWGPYGSDRDRPALEIGAQETDDNALKGFLRIGGKTLDTTGYLGAVKDADGEWHDRALPYWATLPSYRSLALGRRWHLFFAWLFVANLAVYCLVGLANGHLRRDLLPTRKQLNPRALLADVVHHVKLQFPRGEAARHYNPLQKLAYLGVVAVLLPTVILTGLTMSPGMDAILPWLIDLFGGRQSARTIHFIAASLIVLFILVHLVMVVLAGPINEIRSMITGKLKIEVEAGHEPDRHSAP